jgi:Ni/Co efflux regulator RcnB
MRKSITTAIAAVTALGSVLTAMPAQAQYRDRDRDGIPDRREWNRDRDHDGRLDQYDRNNGRQMRYWGGRYGYNGYQGRWRTGQRYPYYKSRSYWIDDYSRYGLAPPWRGYRYYRTDNGDIVMAAIATGLIGLIASGALNDDRGYYRHRRY